MDKKTSAKGEASKETEGGVKEENDNAVKDGKESSEGEEEEVEDEPHFVIGGR